jgi:hypothetical protein
MVEAGKLDMSLGRERMSLLPSSRVTLLHGRDAQACSVQAGSIYANSQMTGNKFPIRTVSLYTFTNIED